jgi:hypothetical protein
MDGFSEELDVLKPRAMLPSWSCAMEPIQRKLASGA